MTEKSLVTSLIAGILISLLGLCSTILGLMSIINSESGINVGTIVFGLIIVNAGIACIIGGVGHIFLREWASKIVFYGAIIVILVCLVGVLHISGFVIGFGYAILIMIAAMAIMWYLSKRELGAFFLLSVAEHLIIIVIVIMLIYSGPINAVPEESVLTVTMEEIKKEPEPPLIKIVPPKKKAKQEKKADLVNTKKEPNESITPPKLKIKSTTDVDSGSQMASVPKLPRTFADIPDSGSGKDPMLRSPGPEKGIKRSQETAPTIDNSVGSALKGARKTEFTGVVPTFEGGKGKGGTAVGKSLTYNPGNSSFPVGTTNSSGATRPGFVGDIRGEVAGRKVLSWPKLPEEVKGTEGGSATLEITVDPAGNVTKVKIVKKSGNNMLDRIAMGYVKQIRFEELPKSVQQKDQRGEVVINFELAK